MKEGKRQKVKGERLTLSFFAVYRTMIFQFKNESSLTLKGLGMPNPYGFVQDFRRRGEACLAQRFTNFILSQIQNGFCGIKLCLLPASEGVPCTTT